LCISLVFISKNVYHLCISLVFISKNVYHLCILLVFISNHWQYLSIPVTICWEAAPCIFTVTHERFGRICCLQSQSINVDCRKQFTPERLYLSTGHCGHFLWQNVQI
jgi:hypothetical protein